MQSEVALICLTQQGHYDLSKEILFKRSIRRGMSRESWSAPSEQPGDVFSWQAYTMQEGPPRKWPRKEEKESRRTPSTLSNNIQAVSEPSEERLKP
jgi:hypothetical protein